MLCNQSLPILRACREHLLRSTGMDAQVIRKGLIAGSAQRPGLVLRYTGWSLHHTNGYFLGRASDCPVLTSRVTRFADKYAPDLPSAACLVPILCAGDTRAPGTPHPFPLENPRAGKTIGWQTVEISF